MGLLDRLLGRRPRAERGYGAPPPSPPPPSPRPTDDKAIERYRYLLRTAPPDQIEQAHAEAFAQLTPEQRRQVLEQLSAAGERPGGDDARALARAATRAELRRPGFLERAFGGGGGYGPGYGGGYGPGYGGGYGPGYGGGYGYGGPGFGSMVGGSMLGTIGGLVIGTAVADALFDTGPGDGGLFGGGDEDYREGFADGERYDDGYGPGNDGGYDAADGGYDAGDGGWDGGGDDFGGGGDF